MKSLRTVIFLSIVSIALLPAFFASAQTHTATADIQALVKQLQEQIKTLQAQVQELKSQLAATKEEDVVAKDETAAVKQGVVSVKQELVEVKQELQLTRPLQRGVRGDDVRKLQEFLAQFRDIYPQGLITGFYGPATEAAVRKLQAKHGIESIGTVGPRTLVKVNELISEGAGKSGLIPPGLLRPPGIQKKTATTTILEVPLPYATTTPSLPTATTTPAIPAQPIGQTGTTTIPAIPAIPITQATSTTATTISPVVPPPAPVPAPPPPPSTVSTPSNSLIKSVLTDSKIQSAESIFISGRYAYIAAFYAFRLVVVDIVDPLNPKIVGSVYDAELLQSAQSVTVSGNYAYVAARGSHRLTIVDISNPINPVIVGSVRSTDHLVGAFSVRVAGAYAYVAGYVYNTLAIVDVSNPSNPVIKGSIRDSVKLEGAYSVDVVGSYAYVTARNGHVTVVDISRPTAPVIVGFLSDVSKLNGASYLQVSGSYAYVTAYNAKCFVIVNISNPSSPLIAGSVCDPNQLNGPGVVSVNNNRAYIAVSDTASLPVTGNGRLIVVNIENPSNPFISGSVTSSGREIESPRGLAVSGNYVYVGNSISGMAVIDISGFAPATTPPSPPAPTAVTQDTAPPVISNIQATNITATSAVITWITNEAADSQVEYDLTTSYGSQTVLDVDRVTSHSASLAGLTASTAYHYRVKSKDAAGNLATSADQTFTTAAAPAAALPAPIAGDTGTTHIGAVFGAGGTAPSYSGIYTLGLRFRYDAGSISSVQSFRVYQKKPGEATFTVVATFPNPAPLVNSGGSIRSGTFGAPNSWTLNYIASSLGPFWEAQTSNTQSLSSSSNFPVGEYSSYIVAVDSSGVESPPSATMKHVILDRTTILSPVGGQTASNPTFSWTTASGWPQNPSYYIRAYDTSSVVWSKNVSVSVSASTGSSVYDGPALDPGKTYTVYIDAPGLYYNNTPYTSMNDATQTFWNSAATATTTSTAQAINALASLLQSISQLLQQLKKLGP